ncbi:NAD(P)/FAD-dependent oxidoreductase [Geomonas sp. RF6]|uniref:phytoene desaturase family protein n=1 Tax=Geomonas sp. RF6 TaxID=2897342 RepID=UPI001E4112F8|nr:NAD(P)/FAD-dependent oxidoreductase [Geomonas sp. RF6]UFS72137.1 NAD(P)/FAD-dependent oxidoreductase [Geomonas sp. RF6]
MKRKGDRGGGGGRREVFVVGSGPNGLAAAIEMARHGHVVTVLEGSTTIGGGARTEPLTLPGFLHDVCSAIHPLAASSPFFRELPLERFGLRWIDPPAALAHPLDDGTTVLLMRDIEGTVASLDGKDAAPYRKIFAPLTEKWDGLSRDLLAPVHLPRHPLAMARFGMHALLPATSFLHNAFSGTRARALIAGMCAHSFLPLEQAGSASFGLVLGTLGHFAGWPVAAGGSGRLSAALAKYLEHLGGKILVGRRVANVDEFPAASLKILDITPRQLLALAGHRFPERYREKLGRYRYGPAVFKIDWALDGPIPWRDPACLHSATVHLGGTLEEIAASEREVWRGGHPERPFVLVAQQSLFDPERAPKGKHTGWAYCHVPNGSRVDMTERIERQMERFAPGFRELILARQTRNSAGLQLYNENFVGGDVNGGVQDLAQIVRRPVAGPRPYATPDSTLFICSSSTPPGGGVHGMAGYHAARCVIASLPRR